MKTYSNQPRGEKLKAVACSLCGEKKYSPRWDCGDFSFVKCSGCGVLYQNPQPVKEELLQRYDQDYFSYEIENEASFYRLMDLGLQDGGFETWSKDLPSPRRFLDIGCATGILLENIRSKGWEVKGVEVCTPSAKYGIARRGLDISMVPLEQSGLEDNSFDAVHFSHLVEHLNDPGPFLREVHRVLKPGGRAFITTPNTEGFQARWFQSSWRSAIADHLYLFSKSNLTRSLRDRGFSIIKTKTWGGLAVGAGPQWLKSLLDPLSKAWGFGDVVLVVAEKRS